MSTSGHYVTSLFRGIHPDLVSQWHDLMVQLGLPAPGATQHSPWMILSSSQVLPVLHAFRNRGLPWSEVAARGTQAALDFERLYTNLPQVDLIAKLGSLVDGVFARHNNAAAVKVFKQKGLPLIWLYNVPQRLCATERGQRYQTFTPASIKQLISFLVENTYVTFGNRIYHQTLGIPMGISPAVYISNYYLYWYEFQFYQQLVPMQGQGVRSILDVSALRASLLAGVPSPGGPADVAALVIDSFLYTARYIDDMYSLVNPIRTQLLYTNQVWHGVTGIYTSLYPSELRIMSAATRVVVPYMDLHIHLRVCMAGQPDGPPYMVGDFAVELFC
jgi:hypothetical protein